MRILTVCTNYRVFGAETMSLNILEAFKKGGHEQLAVTGIWSDGGFSRRLELLCIPEIQLPLGALAKKFSRQALWWTANTVVRMPRVWFGWQRALKQFRPDVLLLTSPKQGLQLLPWPRKLPSFLIEHSMKENSSANRWMYRVLDGKLAGFIPVSQFMASHLQQLGIAPARMRVIYNCVEPTVRADGCEPSGFSGANPGSPRIGIVGQISPHKGYDCLVEAAALLKDRGLKFEVRVFGIGDAEYVRQLEHRIADAELTTMWRWMDYLSDQQALYGSMDVCVVPSCFDEPFGMVALEASSFGLPVIASRRGGLPEIVEHGVTGWLIDSDSPEQLAGRIEWMVKHPDETRAMGTAGRHRVSSHFTADKMVGEFQSLFRQFVPWKNGGRHAQSEPRAAYGE